MTHPFDPYLLFERSANRSPSSPALSIAGREWTYGELLQKAHAYAAWCHANAAVGGRVAVFGRKTLEAYAAILGILAAGRSYVPLHPEHPPARWSAMLQQAGVSAGFITEADLHLVKDLPLIKWFSGPDDEPAPIAVTEMGNDPEAYVMFTSGSTGGPKGVPVGRIQVAYYLQHQLATYDLRSSDRCTQFFALTFDLSVHDLFVCWGAGACLCVPAEADVPLRAAAFVREQRISVWFSVPSQVQVMRRMRALKPGSLPGVRITFFCGEALPSDLAADWARTAPESRVIDLYGPTETTIAVTAHEYVAGQGGGGVVPIGKAFKGHEVLVAADGAFQREGEGELLIHGPQVNAGYLNDPAATSAAFIAHDGRRWYRTGDHVRIAADGVIHFLGRMDDQVKLMGHRVEPAEVDSLLAGLLGGGTSITLPVVLEGAARLVTFIDVEADIPALFHHLRAHLPAYMVPEKIIYSGAFQYGPHGKLDRQALIRMATGP